MRLQSDLALLPLDDAVVAFSAEAQCLVGLNASAALIVGELRNGTPAADLAGILSSRSHAAPAQAEEWVRSTLQALELHGMIAGVPAPRPLMAESPTEEERAAAIAGMPEYSPFEPAVEQHFRLLGTLATIRFGSRKQVRLVNSVLGHLRVDDAAAPGIIIDLKATVMEDGNLHTDIYRDTIPVGFAPRLSLLGPLTKAALWQAAVNAHDFQFYIHAGVVGTGTSCILLPAAQGSGKSSLVAALTHAGFRYFSDEVALIEPDGFQVPALPLAICVKESGWDVIAPYYPEIADLPTHRRKDGKVLRYLHPPADAIRQSPAPVSHIIFPRYEADAPTELRPVSRAEALGRLMGECLALRRRLDPESVAGLLRWIGRVECRALTFSSLDAATRLVAGLAPQVPGQPPRV